MLDHVDLVAEHYFSCILNTIFSSIGRVTGSMPPRYGSDLVRRPIIRVARTRVIGQGRTRSIGIMSSSSDQPTNIFLQVSFLYEAFNLVSQLEAFNRVMPPVLMELAVFHHVPSFGRSSHWAWVAEQVFPLHLHEDLLPRSVKWSVAVEAASEGF